MFWYRTVDHPAANNADPVLGAKAWNIYFDADNGGRYCIHVGENTRQEMLKQLSDDAVKVVTEELLAQM